MEGHVKLLAFVYIAYHALGVLLALLVLGILSGVGLLSGEWEAAGILTVIGFVIAALVTILALPGIIGGIGLLFRQQWARMLILIVGFFSLFEFPLGTLMGVYTFWVLMHDETKPLFSRYT